MVKNYLIESTSKNSNGLYKLEIKDLRISLWNSRIDLTGVKLVADPNRWQELKDDTTFAAPSKMEFDIPEVQLLNIAWFDFLRTSKLSIDTVIVHKPEIGYEFDLKQRKEQTENLKEMIYSGVTSFSDDMTIKEIIVYESGVDLAIYNEDLEFFKRLDNMRIRFDNMSINKESLNSQNKLFFCDNIHFHLEHIGMNLPGQSTLDMRNIGVSTADSTLTFESVKFNRKDSLKIDLEKVVASRIRVKELIENQNLKMDKVLIESPYVLQKKTKNFKAFTLEMRQNLEASLTSAFNEFHVDTFMVTKADIDIEKRDLEEGFIQYDKFENVSVLFKNIHFDKDSLHTAEHILYADYLSLKADKLGSIRKDSSFYAYIEDVNVSTRDSIVPLKNIHFYQEGKLKADIPNVQLYLPDWKRYWDEGTVHVYDVDVFSPVVEYDIKPGKQVTDKKTVADVISTFCVKLEVTHLDLENGTLSRKALSSKGQPTSLEAHGVYLSLNNIEITPGMSNKQTNHELFSDLENIRARNFEFSSGNDIKLSAASLRTSGHHTNVMINKFAFNKGGRINLTMDTLDVKGIEWEKFWKEPEHLISIYEIELNKPSIAITSYDQDTIYLKDKEALSLKKLLPSLIQPFSQRMEVDHIIIDNGKFRHNLVYDSTHNHLLQNIGKLNFKLENLVVESDTVTVSDFLFSKKMDINIENYSFKLPNSEATVQFKKFHSSTRDSLIKVTDVRFKKGKDIAITIPEINIDKIGWSKYWSDNSLDIHYMSINDPIINFQKTTSRNNKDTTDRFHVRDLDELLPQIVSKFSNLLTIEQLLVDNGKFNSKIKVRDREIVQSAEQIKITFDKLRIDSSYIKNTGQFLFSNNVQLRLNNYQFTPDDSLYTIEAKWLEANSIDSSIAFRDITYKKDSTISVDIDLLALHSMAIQKYIETNNLQIQRLDFDSINIVYQLFDSISDTSSTNSAKRSIDEIIKSFAYSIEVNEVTMDKKAPGNITFISDNFTQSFNNVSFTVDEVKVDTSYEYDVNEFPFAKSITFEAQQYRNEPRDSIDYRITMGPIKASSASKTLDIGNFNMAPLRSSEDFMQNLTYREPRYELKMNNVQGTGVDYISLINKGEVNVSEVRIKQPLLTVFEDKNIPRDSSVFPKMPNDIFRELSFPLDLKYIIMSDANIVYKQREFGESEIGVINFSQKNNDYITASHVSNRKHAAGGEYPTKLDAQAHFMDTGRVTLHVYIDLLSEELKCKYAFFLGEMNAHHLNKFVMGTANLELKKGRIIRIENIGDAVYMNDHYCYGEMKAVYNNFKIRLFQKGTKAKRRFVSFIGNLILSSTNKKDQAEISYYREPYDSFIRYIWQGIKSGLERTMLPGFMQKDDKKK